jgi:glycosyltransferase involved in cell wall biosynthesis
MVHANLLARLSRLLVPIPVVVSTIHNQDEGAQWRYVAYRLTDRLSDVTTSVSRLAVDEAVRRGAVARGRIQLVPNGIALGEHGRKAVVRDTARRDLGLSDRFIWLAVGRLAEAKAYPDMVAAFRRVVDADTRAVLLIAGEGPLEPAIRSAIDSAGLQDRVRLLGRRSDVPVLMQAADAFVMSSVWEGLPIVLLEASASSLPIVATDVGGSRDTIVDGSSGHITAPAAPAALAGAMLSVMALPEADRLAMGEVAREHVSRVFDLETVADAWDDLYRRHLPVVRR